MEVPSESFIGALRIQEPVIHGPYEEIFTVVGPKTSDKMSLNAAYDQSPHSQALKHLVITPGEEKIATLQRAAHQSIARLTEAL